MVALGTGNIPYNARCSGTQRAEWFKSGTIPLVAEVAATGPAVLQGFVSPLRRPPAGATADVSLAPFRASAVLAVDSAQLNIPLQNAPRDRVDTCRDLNGLDFHSDSTELPNGQSHGGKLRAVYARCSRQ